MKQLPGTHTWLRLKNDSVATTTDNVTDSGTSLLESRVKLALGASDDGVVYRCLEMNGDVTQASASYTLRVQCEIHFTSLILTLVIYLPAYSRGSIRQILRERDLACYTF